MPARLTSDYGLPIPEAGKSDTILEPQKSGRSCRSLTVLSNATNLTMKTGLKHCAAHIQICGPVSGIYKLEVLPTQNGTYSITVMGTSESKRDQAGPHSTASRAQYKSEIRKQSPDVLTLNYSREAGSRISLGRSESASRGQ